MSPSIKINDMTVEPYEYREDSKNDALVIMAKAVLSLEQHNRLMTMQQSRKFVPVVRLGVDEEPKQMIFGMPIWSESNTEYKHELILCETRAKPSVLTLWKNLYPFIAENKAAIESLLEILRKKEFLSAADEFEINRNINERLGTAIYDLWRVEDIDEYEM